MRTTRSHLVPPTNVAVVGASELGGTNYVGARVLRNLLDSSDGIPVYAVNPRYRGQQVMGVGGFATLTDLPEVPDLVIVAIPASAVAEVLAEAGSLGVQTCVVLSRETGGSEARERFLQRIREVSRMFDMRIIGPNSMGVLCGTTMVNGSFASGAHGHSLRPGPVAMLSQSGSSISYLLQLLRQTAIGYSWLMSTGDEAAAPLEVLFEQVVEDTNTRVILLFVEGVADGARFRRAALRARILGKPVVLLQVGRSTTGREAVQTHTGRLAGVEKAFEAIARESGITRVTSYEQFYDVAEALVQQAVPRARQDHRRRAVVVTTSGGAGAYAADCLSELGWTLPTLPDDVREELESIADQGRLHNPVDVTGSWADPTMLPAIFDTIARESTLDAIVLASGAGGTLGLPVAQALAQVRDRIPQEIYVGWVGMSPEVAAVLANAGISAFPDPRRAAYAAEVSAAFRCGQQDRDSAQELLTLLCTAETPTTALANTGRNEGVLAAGDTLASLEVAGVPCAPSRLAVDDLGPEAVGKLTAEVGFPLAMKLDSSRLLHKTEQGAVAVGIADAAEAERQRAAFVQIVEREQLTDARILLQKMVGGVEVLLGLKRDPAFGLLLVVGVGGVNAELFPDVNALVLPTTDDRLDELIASHPLLGTLLGGYRGAEPANRAALLDVARRFADWGMAQGARLAEADVNPVMVDSRGAFAVDARAVLSEGGAA